MVEKQKVLTIGEKIKIPDLLKTYIGWVKNDDIQFITKEKDKDDIIQTINELVKKLTKETGSSNGKDKR